MKTFYIAWQDPETRRWQPVGKLTFENNLYRFVYTKGAASAKNFVPFGVMKDLTANYESSDLFPLFHNRLLSRNRPEYNDYLNWLNISPDQDDQLSQLALTGGIRGTDSLMVFPCPEPRSDGTYHVKFFCHGVRYLAEEAQKLVEHLKPGARLYLMLDVQNEQDGLAIALRAEPAMIVGYVPRYFTGDFRLLLSSEKGATVKVFVERVNPVAPIQYRLLCNITAIWPKGFRPFSNSLYQPLGGMKRSVKKAVRRRR